MMTDLYCTKTYIENKQQELLALPPAGNVQINTKKFKVGPELSFFGLFSQPGMDRSHGNTPLHISSFSYEYMPEVNGNVNVHVLVRDVMLT